MEFILKDHNVLPLNQVSSFFRFAFRWSKVHALGLLIEISYSFVSLNILSSVSKLQTSVYQVFFELFTVLSLTFPKRESFSWHWERCSEIYWPSVRPRHIRSTNID